MVLGWQDFVVIGIIVGGKLVEQTSLAELGSGGSLEERFLEVVGGRGDDAPQLPHGGVRRKVRSPDGVLHDSQCRRPRQSQLPLSRGSTTRRPVR